MKDGNSSFDLKRIDLERPEHIRFWTAEFGCTECQLRDAVQAVGDITDDISGYLAKREE